MLSPIKLCRFLTVLIFSFLALPLMAANASVENNSMRLGDDYKIFNMHHGADHLECRAACDDDKKCQAWTFIRERVKTNKGLSFNLGKGFSLNLGGEQEEIIPAQCRLKHSAGAVYKNDCCVSGVTRVVQEKSTRREDVCTKLARRSVKQNDKNISENCNLRGRQWSGRYSRHFDRCMDEGPREFRIGIRERKDRLENCAQNRKKLNRACDRYARLAVKQADENADNSCGNRGRAWATDYDVHYEKCQNTSSAKRKELTEDRATKVSACIARGGGAYNSACDAYATKAVEDQNNNKDLNCGYKGQRWDGRFASNYQSCLKMTNWRRRSETNARKDALQTCKVNLREEKRVTCRSFAREALNLQIKNEDNECGFTRRTRWHDNRRRHISYCRDLTNDERISELGVRKDAIKRCVKETNRESSRQKRQRCRNYANLAVKQIRKANVNSCGFEGRLWNGKFRELNEWCLDAPVRRQERRERRRTRQLDRCIAQRKAEAIELKKLEKACNIYADQAVEDSSRAAFLGCGLQGSNWKGTRDEHLNRCMQLSKKERVRIGKRRTSKLRQCEASRGEKDARRCDVFVKRALQHVRSNSRRNCHFRGKGFWHGNEKRYMKQCLNLTADERAESDRRRRVALRQCRDGEPSEFSSPKKARCLKEPITGIGYSRKRDSATKNAINAWTAGAEKELGENIEIDRDSLSAEAVCDRRRLTRRGRHPQAGEPHTYEDGRAFFKWACVITFEACRDKGNAGPGRVKPPRDRRGNLWLDHDYGSDDGWKNAFHPRLVGDINGDGADDIVGFGDATVRTSRSRTNSFEPARKVIRAFGRRSGGWSVAKNPRVLADVNGDGRKDIVGFGNSAVFVSIAKSNGSFKEAKQGISGFGAKKGGWSTQNHIRTLADVDGDGAADIVGFGNRGVFVSLSRRNGRFETPENWINAFGKKAGGWDVRQNPRFLGDINGDGQADIVGIGNRGIYVATAGNGQFNDAVLFDSRLSQMLRDGHEFVALMDVTNDGRADLISVTDDGLYYTRTRRGRFSQTRKLADVNPSRYDHYQVGDVNGDKVPDFIGFKNDGTYVVKGQK